MPRMRARRPAKKGVGHGQLVSRIFAIMIARVTRRPSNQGVTKGLTRIFPYCRFWGKIDPSLFLLLFDDKGATPPIALRCHSPQSVHRSSYVTRSFRLTLHGAFTPAHSHGAHTGDGERLGKCDGPIGHACIRSRGTFRYHNRATIAPGLCPAATAPFYSRCRRCHNRRGARTEIFT